MPWSAAMRAASSGSGPVVRRPSVSSTIADDVLDPAGTGFTSFFSAFFSGGRFVRHDWRLPRTIDSRSIPSSGNRVASDMTMPLPIAVWRAGRRPPGGGVGASFFLVGFLVGGGGAGEDTEPAGET